MKNSAVSYFIIFLAFILTSCSVTFEKRRYRPGYHIEVSNHQQDRPQSKAEQTPAVKGSPNQIVPVQSNITMEKKADQLEKLDVLPVKKDHSPQSQIKKREKKKRELDSCDVIVMATGERVEARVIEIGEGYVNYKLCNDPKGRVYTIKTKTIDNITLRNGDLFIPEDRVVVDKEKERKKSGILFVMAIISLSIAFLAFVFSFFIPPLATISFSLSIFNSFFSFIILLLDIRPGKYAPSYRTKLTWIFCLIALVLFIVSMILVLL